VICEAANREAADSTFNERALFSRAGATALRRPDYRPDREYDFRRVREAAERARRRRRTWSPYRLTLIGIWTASAAGLLVLGFVW
jgi:hypothetical protein